MEKSYEKNCPPIFKPHIYQFSSTFSLYWKLPAVCRYKNGKPANWISCSKSRNEWTVEFTFTTEAKTESLWKALYDYSRSEKSTGNETDGQVINEYFSVIEKIKGEVRKDYEINIVTDKNYALSSTGEEFEIKPGLLVDPLSVYLALSNEMINNPDPI